MLTNCSSLWPDCLADWLVCWLVSMCHCVPTQNYNEEVVVCLHRIMRLHRIVCAYTGLCVPTHFGVPAQTDGTIVAS